MKRTKGPWGWADRMDDRDNPCGINITGNDYIVARIPDGATIKGGKAFPHQLGDAALIKAAPQLLKAIQDLLDYTGGWDITDPDHPIFKARIALDAATGESR